jgi:hypothetical protein
VTKDDRRRLRAARTGLVAAASLVALLPSVLAGAVRPANAAAPESACDDATGVTVVVDFADLGGGVEVRCAGWPVASGLDALDKAGFDVDLVLTQPGFVCRIDGVPADDPCQVTPPADAYWAYYEADRGGDWHYSIRGPASTHPEEGSVEGWAFGDSRQPGVPPPPPYEEPTEPPPTQTEPPPSSPPHSAPQSPSRTPTSDPAPSSTSPEVTVGSDASAPADFSDAPQSTAPPTGTDSTTTTRTSEPAAGGSDSDSSSPAGALVAIGAVVIIGGAAGATAWRRRRLSEGA